MSDNFVEQITLESTNNYVVSLRIEEQDGMHMLSILTMDAKTNREEPLGSVLIPHWALIMAFRDSLETITKSQAVKAASIHMIQVGDGVASDVETFGNGGYV